MTAEIRNLVSVGGNGLEIGAGRPLAIICGPCVIESREHCLKLAEEITAQAQAVGLPLIFKSSYDKANRTSSSSYRGVGIEEGLAILAEVRREFGVPVVTDVHTAEQAHLAAEAVDLIQIPAFLCRQTDLLLAAGKTNKPVMVKKGQFVHPSDMHFAAQKVAVSGDGGVLLCERGTTFGYRELVVDYRSLTWMAQIGCPVIFDATHSVQIMGGQGGSSGGNRSFVPALARAAVAVGVNGIFLEAHNDPDNAPSDGPNMVPLTELGPLLEDLKNLSELKLATRL